MPVQRPKMNLTEVLNPWPRLVTTTKILSGPGVNAKTTDAMIKVTISERDKTVIFQFYRHALPKVPTMVFVFLLGF